LCPTSDSANVAAWVLPARGDRTSTSHSDSRFLCFADRRLYLQNQETSQFWVFGLFNLGKTAAFLHPRIADEPAHCTGNLSRSFANYSNWRFLSIGSNLPAITSAEIAVEYVLKMREFPQDSLLLSLLERGLLTEQLMADLGREVANFHSTAISNSYIRRFGEVSQIRTAIDNNYLISQNIWRAADSDTISGN
jgi:hypothetical protein